MHGSEVGAVSVIWPEPDVGGGHSVCDHLRGGHDRKVNRAIVSLLAAGLMIVLGVLNQEAAIRGIDFNTIGLLIGMMVIVAITRQSGVFQFMAIWAARRSMPDPGAFW